MQDKKRTEKYIKEYLKKKYKNRRGRQLKPSSVAASVMHALFRELKSLNEILKEVAESGSTILPYPAWHPEAHKRKYYSVSQLSRGLSTLERGGYVKREGKRTVFLTRKGVREILKYKMKNKYLDRRWDGKWRIIIFDIEEATRKDRDYLRSQLRWIGFQELQKSVWAFPYEIRDELKEFIKLCKFEFQGDVRFILAENIEPDVEMRKKFGLK